MSEQLPLDSEDMGFGDIKSYIKSIVSHLGPTFSKEQKKEHANLLLKIFEKGMSPKQAMEIKDEEIAQIYSFAYHQFAGGKFTEARELFKMLLTLDPFNSEFATALGVCHHRLKDYTFALQCYMLNAMLAPKDPVALFYAYDCYMNLKEETLAGIMLCNVIARAGDQVAYAQIKKTAQALLEKIQDKILDAPIDAIGKSS